MRPRVAGVRAGWMIENIFHVVLGQVVPRDVLDVAFGIFIAIPNDGSEIQPGHSLEGFFS